MLSEAEQERIEQVLLRERSRILDDMQEVEQDARGLAADGDLTNYPFHQADQGTDTEEQEKAFLLASHEGRRIQQIDDALRRLRDDPEHFGECENCGKQIRMERLELVPESPYCAECQRVPDAEAIPPTTGQAI